MAALGTPGPGADDPVAKALLETGLQLEGRGQIPEAVSLYERVLNCDVAHPDFRAHASLRLGLIHAQVGQEDRAIELFQFALIAHNTMILRVACYHAGTRLASRGRYHDAYDIFVRMAEHRPITQFEPSELAARCLLTAMRIRLGKHHEALPAFRSEPDATEAGAAFELAKALDDTEQIEDAIPFYAAVAASESLLHTTRDYARTRQEVLTEFLRLRDAPPGTHIPVPVVFEQICRYLRRGGENNVAEANRLCEQLAQSPAEHLSLAVAALINVGVEMERIGRPNGAQRLYRRVLSMQGVDEPNRRNASVRLGLLLAADNRHEEAIPLLYDAIEDNTDLNMVRPAVETLVYIHSCRSEWEEARDIAALGAEVNAGDPQESLFWHLRYVQFRAHRNDVEEYDDSASSLLTGVRPETPRTASAWFDAAMALEVSGYLPQSRIFYQELLNCKPLPPGMRTRAMYRVGMVLDRLMQFREAQAMLHAAVISDDTEPEAQAEARLRLANLRFLMDEFDAVIDDFEDLRRTGTTGRIRCESQIRYATCLMRLGNAEAAKAELEQSRQSLLQGTEFEVKADLMLAEMAENESNRAEAMAAYERIMHNPLSEPLTKAAALTRFDTLRRNRR